MTQYDPGSLERLSFRRQFCLGPSFIDGFPSWQRVALDAGWLLTAHPDLDVCRVARGDRWVALLGYILDPAHPDAGNVDVVTGLLETFHTRDDLLEQSDRFGGRWVMVAHDGVRTFLFADAAGLREVVYTTGTTSGQRWCASRAALLEEVIDLPLDPEAADFVQQGRAGGRMLWLPGDSTRCVGVKLLLPNHYLDLNTGRPSRFWPREDLPVVPLRAAIASSSEILLGLMESAARRFDLMLALTAGWDSRLTLAATRSRAQGIFIYTAAFHTTAPDALDLTAPSSLLAKLGLKHRILDCRIGADDEFAEIYRRNVRMAYAQHCAMAQAMFDQTPSEGVVITGDVGEIAKCVYRLGPSSNRDVTAHELAVLTRQPTHTFVLRALEGWLSEARADCHNVPLLDLYCWEQEAGRLQALIQAECDIARESFAPLNCRSLLTTMLSVPERYRQEPTLDLFRGIMERLWPDVLQEPINGRPQVGPEAALRRALDKLGLLRLVPRPVKGMVKGLIRTTSALGGRQ